MVSKKFHRALAALAISATAAMGAEFELPFTKKFGPPRNKCARCGAEMQAGKPGRKCKECRTTDEQA